MKQSNICRGKKLAVIQLDGRDTSSALRGGVKMRTKLLSITRRTKENPKLKFTSLVHLLTVDSLESVSGSLKGIKLRGRWSDN